MLVVAVRAELLSLHIHRSHMGQDGPGIHTRIDECIPGSRLVQLNFLARPDCLKSLALWLMDDDLDPALPMDFISSIDIREQIYSVQEPTMNDEETTYPIRNSQIVPQWW